MIQKRASPPNISSKYIFALNDSFMAYPNNCTITFHYKHLPARRNLEEMIIHLLCWILKIIVLPSMTTIQISSLDSIREAAKSFIAAMDDRTVFAFHGPMGAGKTTFIKAICEELA